MSSASEIKKIIKHKDNEKFVRLMNYSVGIVIIKDNSDKVVWGNPALLREIGKDDFSHIVGKSMNTILPFVPKDKYAKIDAEVISTKESQLGLIEVVDTALGKDQILRIDKIPFINCVGKCIGVITYIMNVSDSLESVVKTYNNEIAYQDLRTGISKVICSLRSSN